MIKIDQRKYFAHRLAWFYVHKHWPLSDIDHINRVKIDNRLSNLRSVTRKQNQENQAPHSNSTSGVLGVHMDKTRNKWVARIKHFGKTIFLGRFTSFDEAVSARKAAEKIYFTHGHA